MLVEDLKDARLPQSTDAGLPLKFHSFRVTCATLMGTAGMNANQIASITGHRSRAMVDHYTHATLDMARKAVSVFADV